MNVQDSSWRTSMRIRVDVNCMMKDRIGTYGFSSEEMDALQPQLDRAAKAMVDDRAECMKWRELPHNQNEVVKQILDVSANVRNHFDTFVVLGIGGSALGPLAVQQALSHLHYNDLPAERRAGPRLFVEDNVDPERMQALLDVIDIKNTCFNVITKSGSTSETMSQLLIIVDKLKEAVGDSWTEHVIATTDSEKGNLIKIAQENNLTRFVVPDGVGGRFSELCPVGLLPAAVCGIDIKALLAGAAYADEICQDPNIWKNPAYILATLHVLGMKRGMNINVLMPYADSLKYVSDWFAQLWAESLGKRYDNLGKEVYVGQTPVKALGVTDQHSQVQLYTEGPFDKIIAFLGVDRYRTEYPISHGFEAIPDIAFLGGHSLNELISAEQRATEYAVQVSGHPSYTITLPEVNAFTIGQLLYLFEVQTAFAGELLNINTFDQPGVEAGKQATYALLGKNGYDEKREELAAQPAPDPKFII